MRSMRSEGKAFGLRNGAATPPLHEGDTLLSAKRQPQLYRHLLTPVAKGFCGYEMNCLVFGID